MEIFSIMISSSVVATLITTMVGWYKDYKKNILNRITDERKQWRVDMRKYLTDFQSEVDFEKSKKVLANIKISINPWGIFSPEKYLLDGHIWYLVDVFEKSDIGDTEKQIRIKDAIIKAISCLLKNDWERSKEEIKGNLFFSSSVMVCCIGIVIFLVAVFLSGSAITTNLTTLCGSVLASILVICTTNYLILTNQFTNEAKYIFKSNSIKFLMFHIFPITIHIIVAVLGYKIADVDSAVSNFFNLIESYNLLITGGLCIYCTSAFSAIIVSLYSLVRKRELTNYFLILNEILSDAT